MERKPDDKPPAPEGYEVPDAPDRDPEPNEQPGRDDRERR